MAKKLTIQQRLAALEAAVVELQRKLAARGPNPNWAKIMEGSMKRFPDFGKVIEYGREFRYSDRPSGDAKP